MNKCKVGGRHRLLRGFVCPTTLRLQVQIPSTPSICIIEILIDIGMRKGQK